MMAVRRLPVKSTGSSPIRRWKSVPVKTGTAGGAAAAADTYGKVPKPATMPPAARPWTKRRRPGMTGPGWIFFMVFSDSERTDAGILADTG